MNNMNSNNAEEFKKLFDEMKAEKRNKSNKYIYMGLCFLSGIMFSVLLLWNFKDSKWNPFQPKISNGGEVLAAAKHPMLQLVELADSLNAYGKEKIVKDFVVGDQTYEVNLDSIDTLIPVSKKYAEAGNMESMVAYLYFLNQKTNEISNRDTVKVGRDSTLLTALLAVNSEGGRIHNRVNKVVIGSVSVDIPNDSFAPKDSIGENGEIIKEEMPIPDYYYKVIKHIDNYISEELSRSLAY